MITVVIPVRNRAELVKRTLDSLARQTKAPAAVVLVDNGSADGTLQVLRDWAIAHPATEVVEEHTPGAARARNAGLARVTTPYVLFFDSDDEMPPRHIEQVEAGLKAAGMPDIGAFDMDLITLDGKVAPKHFRHGDAMRNQIFHSILSTQRCVITTDLARRAGGWNESLPVWDDLEFGVRLLAASQRIAYIPLDAPVRAYAQVNSITGTEFSSRAGQWERALDACAGVLAGTRYERLIDYRRAILAGEYCREGHPESARGLVRGLRLRFIKRYAAAGGRGVDYLARILR